MIHISHYISGFLNEFPEFTNRQPWNFLPEFSAILLQRINTTDTNFDVKNGIAIHKTAVIESNVILKAPVIIGENCFIGAHAYMRDGVFLGKSCKIGPGCEIKRSIILNDSTIAHFNFIGDSIIGNRVNFEAGSITANHFNEKTNKTIYVLTDNGILNTGTEKFGTLAGDNSRIGANAVLSPGTLLIPGSIVKRLELIDQVGTNNF